MKRAALPLAALLPAMLAACASLPPAGAPSASSDPALDAAQHAREAALGLADGECAAPAWSLAGRVALSNGKDGGSGRIDWTQGDGRIEVGLSAPVTRQGWRLQTGPDGAALHGVPNGPLHDADPGRLLHGATGWDIPVAALGCWLRGARAAGPAAVAYGADGLPARIEQAGWTIEYANWQADPGAGLALPGRIQAQRGQDRVRLVVDRWGAE